MVGGPIGGRRGQTEIRVPWPARSRNPEGAAQSLASPPRSRSPTGHSRDGCHGAYCPDISRRGRFCELNYSHTRLDSAVNYSERAKRRMWLGAGNSDRPPYK